MRFELTVALKYLIPKWRQLSVSIISLISILVISLVVWLVVLFLSVTEGIEKKWIQELVALNAPVRMTPTEAYYDSYYYQIDAVSLASNYNNKTLGEKLTSPLSDPYDLYVDRELSLDFPVADRYEDGRLKDLVKEGYEAIKTLPYKGLRAQESEVSFGNLRLQILREKSATDETLQSFLTQVSYIASHDNENVRVNQMILPPRACDFNNLLKAIAQTGNISGYENNPPETQAENSNPIKGQKSGLKENLKMFFENLEIRRLQTTSPGYFLPPSLFPKEGRLDGIAVVRQDQIAKIIIPGSAEQLNSLDARLQGGGFQTAPVSLLFKDKKMHVNSQIFVDSTVQILLDEKILFGASLVADSLEKSDSLETLVFQINGSVQNVPISGKTFFKNLKIAEAVPKICSTSFWVNARANGGCSIPNRSSLGEALLISKHFQKNDVQIGDRGYLAYYTLAGNAMQEQRIPVYVAGFYDPGMIPLGNKLIFADPQIAAILRSNATIADPMLGNGINIWFDNLNEASNLKEDLIQALRTKGIDKYWSIQSYEDFEFTRPILEQLRSDKNLFTLIAVIILIVACSNIISMLILLVNDKKKEIGILQSMGSSPFRIATIFGLCGFVTGLTSCIIGVIAAIYTLKNLQSLVSFLSFLQGRDAFQTAFYGSSLPNELSYSILCLVFLATLIISLLAGIIPAAKASKIRPSEILRAE